MIYCKIWIVPVIFSKAEGGDRVPTVFEDQKRLAKDKRLDRQEQWKLIRRSMWISIFLGVTVSVALLSYAFFVKQWENEEPEPSLYYHEQKTDQQSKSQQSAPAYRGAGLAPAALDASSDLLFYIPSDTSAGATIP